MSLSLQKYEKALFTERLSWTLPTPSSPLKGCSAMKLTALSVHSA
jgi:hypothetical protein